jgi:hypothetical protein
MNNPSKILFHITVASKPTELIETIRGQMTYLSWIRDVEIPRFRRKCNWPVDLYTNNKTGEISLVHLRVTPTT